MKGPYQRLKYTMRRVWECPECHHRERTGGNQTSQFCECQLKRGGKPLPMKLIEDGIRRTTVTIPVAATNGSNEHKDEEQISDGSHNQADGGSTSETADSAADDAPQEDNRA